jgi:hypothetical protein
VISEQREDSSEEVDEAEYERLHQLFKMKIEPKKYHEYSAVEQVTLLKRHKNVLEYLLALLKKYIKNPSDFSTAHSRK